MNERIANLAEQGGFENGHQDRYGNSLSHELEKFAELIVQECAGVCENSNYEFGKIFTKMIKEHFGVKE